MRARTVYVACCLALALPGIGVAFPDAEIVGDAQLLELCKNARAANAQLLDRHGELVAQIEEYLDKAPAPVSRANVKCSWCGLRYLSEFVVETPIAGQPKPANPQQFAEFEAMRRQGKDLDPAHVRGLADGRRFYLYFTTAVTSSGHLMIFPSAADAARTLHAKIADQRPAHVWRYSPRVHTWDHWMNLADRKNPNVVKWEIARSGTLVIAKRFLHMVAKDRDEWGVLEFTMDLALAGQVVAYKSGGKSGGFGTERESEEAKYQWEKRSDGIVVLNEWDWRRTALNGGKRIHYKLREFSLAHKNPSDFTEKALNVRAGARVDDKGSGKTYSYGGREVQQADLDKLSEIAKKKIHE